MLPTSQFKYIIYMWNVGNQKLQVPVDADKSFPWTCLLPEFEKIQVSEGRSTTFLKIVPHI